MAESDAPTPPTPPTTPSPRKLGKLLPDEIHRAVRPGTAVLRLRTTPSREGVLDGAWWPRSRHVATELPALVQALTAHLGPITRVGLDTAAWEQVPTRVVVDDRVVHLDSFPVGDDTVLITRGENDHFALLVVPPHTTADAARAAMARAVDADNTTSAAQILVAPVPGTDASDASDVSERSR